MDLDAFVALHAAEWARLETLCKTRHLTGAQADELVLLHSQVATQLSQLRSAAPDPALISRLSTLLGRSRTRISGAVEPAWSDVVRFFTTVLPIACYRIRWWSVGVSVAFLGVALVVGIWVATEPSAQAVVGTPNEIRQLVDEQFASYYSENPHSSFAMGVWTNNAWIAAQCLAFGISGFWPVYMLWQNAVNLGATGGVMVSHGAADVFFGLIAPHGLLELSCVMVAGAAGLRLFWAWVVPGPRTRGQSLAHEGRSLFTVAIALVCALAVAGLIEGYVTPSTLPGGVKIAIGVIPFAAMWVGMFWWGGHQAKRGETSDVPVGDGADSVAVSG